MSPAESIQQLYLLQMSLQAMRTQINLQLDGLEAEITKLIPEEDSRNGIRSVDWVDKSFERRLKKIKRLKRKGA